MISDLGPGQDVTHHCNKVPHVESLTGQEFHKAYVVAVVDLCEDVELWEQPERKEARGRQGGRQE